MWLGTALLPCSEVLAAVAAHEQALSTDCGHPAEPAPAHGGGHKSAACLDIDEQAPASAENLIALIGGKLKSSVPIVSVSSQLVPSFSAPPVQPTYRAAPSPLAVFLRSSRLLI